jgi:uncharacterized protein (DUF4415 family)
VIGIVAIFVVHTWPNPDGESEETGRIISARRRRTKGGLMKKAISRRLTPQQQAEIDALAALPDDQIKTGDIPEQRDWKGARRGALFRPVKQQITLRLDADLIDWFRRNPEPGEGYQTGINRVLREYVAQHDHD